MKKNVPKKQISNIIKSHIFRVILTVLLFYSIFAIVCQLLFIRRVSMELIDAVVKDVIKTTDAYFIETQLKEYTSEFCKRLENSIYVMKDTLDDDVINLWLQDMAILNSEIVSEINIYDSNGINIYSSEPENVGYDMSSGEQSSEFLCLLNGTDYYEQDFQSSSSDKSKIMKYAGMALYDGKGFFQLGISEDNFKIWKEKILAEEVRYRRIGVGGYMAILNRNFECIGSTRDILNRQIFSKTELLPENEGEYKRLLSEINGTNCFVVSTLKDGYYFIGCFPVKEAITVLKSAVTIIVILIAILVISLYISLTRKLNTSVVKSILNINDSLAKITGGDLTERVNECSSREFEELSVGINRTVERLNNMIEEEAQRLDQELETARVIQTTSLPNVFPPFPNRKEFTLYAMMNTAKEVGGDFYDYYILSENKLAFIIADVSGKGIPAALFMMRARSVIKALAVSGMEVDEVMDKANEELVKYNEAEMFVTVWIGFLDLDTGMLSYVHGGHPCPFLIRDGSISMIKQEREFIVGAIPNLEYSKQEFQLLPNDTLFLYTDGVTEAFDINSDLYGDKRLENALSQCDLKNTGVDFDEYCKEMCQFVRSDVASFSNDVDQSDDITLLCIKYRGKDIPEQ